MVVDVQNIKKLLKSYFTLDGTYTIDPNTGQVSVDGGVQCKFPHHISELPVHFSVVNGIFNCSRMGLRTLKGSPHWVAGSFDCANNYLTDLTHSPVRVGGSYFCSYNTLTSLQGAPAQVARSFFCDHNQLEDLTGAPTQVNTVFDCSGNYSLRNLHSAPEHVGQTFILSYSPDLPLLRLCMYPDFAIYGCLEQVYVILQKYKGTGRSGALKAALELIGTGYPENAKW